LGVDSKLKGEFYRNSGRSAYCQDIPRSKGELYGNSLLPAGALGVDSKLKGEVYGNFGLKIVTLWPHLIAKSELYRNSQASFLVSKFYSRDGYSTCDDLMSTHRLHSFHTHMECE